jgi:murein DD-endopeptidase MepM/ murein hydrolase activator NlpD
MKKKIGNFLKKIRIKYKLSVLNENTLEEEYQFRLSALSLFTLFMGITLITFTLFSILILTTPLKRLLPDNTDRKVRNEVVLNALKIDSLSNELSKRQQYFEVIREILAGDVPIDTTHSTESLISNRIDEKFIEKSDAERAFVEQYEQEEKYNIVNPLTQQQNTNLVFFSPVRGIVSVPFQPRVNHHFGIDISLNAGSSVSSIYKGTVVLTGYDVNNGHFVQVLHPQNFISIYKHVAVVLKKEGDLVKTGEVIAIVNSQGNKPPALRFELWYEGRAQDPQDYILFQ